MRTVKIILGTIGSVILGLLFMGGVRLRRYKISKEYTEVEKRGVVQGA